jgi:hypothetical protein
MHITISMIVILELRQSGPVLPLFLFCHLDILSCHVDALVKDSVSDPDPGFGALTPGSWFRDPVWVKSQYPDPG